MYRFDINGLRQWHGLQTYLLYPLENKNFDNIVIETINEWIDALPFWHLQTSLQSCPYLCGGHLRWHWCPCHPGAQVQAPKVILKQVSQIKGRSCYIGRTWQVYSYYVLECFGPQQERSLLLTGGNFPAVWKLALLQWPTFGRATKRWVSVNFCVYSVDLIVIATKAPKTYGFKN